MSGSFKQVTAETVAEEYVAWLLAERKVVSPEAGGIFAFEMTNFGNTLVGDMTEADICEAIGGTLFKER